MGWSFDFGDGNNTQETPKTDGGKKGGYSFDFGGNDTESDTEKVIKALTGKKLDFKERQSEEADRYNPYSSNPEVARLQRQRDIILNSSNANDPRAKSGLAEIDKLIGQAEQKARIEKLPRNIVTGNTQFLSPLTPFDDVGRNVIPQSAITPMANGYDGSGMYAPYNTDVEAFKNVEPRFEAGFDEALERALRQPEEAPAEQAPAERTSPRDIYGRDWFDSVYEYGKQLAEQKGLKRGTDEYDQAILDHINSNIRWQANDLGMEYVPATKEDLPYGELGTINKDIRRAEGSEKDDLVARRAELHDALGIPTFGERLGLVGTAGGTGALAGYTDAARALYASGQERRTAETEAKIAELEKALEDEYRQRDADEADYRAKYFVNGVDTGPGLENWLTVHDNYIEYYQRQLDAYRKVIPAQEGATEATAEIADELQQKSAEATKKAKTDLNGVERFLVDMGVQGVQMLSDAAVNIAIGTPQSLIPIFARSFGSGTQAARQAGASTDQQILYGAAVGAVEALTEKMFDGLSGLYGKGLADEALDLTNIIIDKVAKESSPAAKRALLLFLGGAGEAVEEGVSGRLDPWLKAIYDNGEELKETYGSVENWLNSWADTGYEMLVAYAMGFAGSTVGVNSKLNEYESWAGNTPVEVPSAVEAPAEVPADILAQQTAPPVNTPTETIAENAPSVTPESVAEAFVPSEAPVEQTSIDASNASEETGVNIPVEQSASETQNNAENEDVYRERGESRNIRTDEARAEELRNFKEQNPDMYKVVKNEKTLQKALDIFDTQGVEGSAATLEQALADARNGKKLPLEMVPLHKLVCDELAKAGQVERANRISSDLGAELTYAGQLEQANVILRNSSATARAKAFAETLDKLISENKAAVDQTAIDDLVDRHRAAETDEARNAVLDDAITAIAQSSPSNLRDMFTALRYTNMLGNFKTQGRNILGNTGMLLAARGKNRILAMEQAAVNAVSNMLGKGNAVTRTNTLTTDSALFKEAWKMFAEDQKAAYGEGKYSDVAQGNQAIREKKTVFKWNWKGDAETRGQQIGRTIADVPMKVLEGYRKATGWAMEQGDVIFQKITYAQVLADYAKAQGYKSLADVPAEQLQTMREYAVKEAQEATFHDKNRVSEAFSGFDKNWSPGMKRFSQGVIPFRQTPANVGVRMEEYSPLGVINTFVDTVNAIQGKKDVNSVLNSLAKTISGTGLATLGFILAKNGLARGKEDDEKLASYEKNVQGLGDYSIVLPDGTTVSLDWLQPESAAFFVGVEAAKYFDDGVQADDFMALLGSTSDIALNMSFLSGLSSSLDDIARLNGDTSAIISYLTNSLISYAGQGFSNSLAGQAEQASEQYRQTTYTDPDSWVPTNIQKKLGQMSAKIPGIDYNQADYIDAWGRRQDNGPVAGRIAESFFSPAYINENRSTEVDDELKRLHEAVGNEIEGTVFPSSPARSTEINGVRLSPEEYETYAVTGGQKALELVTDFINSPGYADLDDKTKAETIKKLYGYAKLDAKNAVLEARGEEPVADKAYEKAKAVMDASGMSWGEYFSASDSLGKSQESTAQYLFNSGMDPEQAEAVYNVYYPDAKHPYSEFADKFQTVADSGFTEEEYDALGETIRAAKEGKEPWDSAGNSAVVDAILGAVDRGLSEDAAASLIIDGTSKNYKNPFSALIDAGHSMTEAMDILSLIDVPDKDGNPPNRSVDQKELVAYYKAHPEEEEIIALIWDAMGYTGKNTKTFEDYKASLK